MAEDVAELRLKVNSKQIKEATKALDKLGKEANQAEKATDGVSSSFGALKGAISVAAILSVATAVAKTADQFQKLNARLVTATGSQEKATKSFEALRDLAFQMPGSVEDVTTAFIQLTNLGLNPSREALISYGNTAAAMGKDLSQLIEAVADAATGEFERLKEFGIKSRNEGDKIAFTFRGVTTRVKNSAEEIEKFLISLGQNEFAGAMEAQNKTLGAAFTDLADSISFATGTLADESGFTSAVTNAANGLARMIRVLSDTQTVSDMEEQLKSMKETLATTEATGIGGFAAALFGNEGAEKLKADIAELTETIRKTKEEMSAGSLGGGPKEEKAVDFSKELDKLREEAMSRLDLINKEMEEKQMLIDQAYIEGQLSEEEHQRLMEDIQKKYADSRIKLAKQEAATKSTIALSVADRLSGLMYIKNKQLFEIGKVAAISSALLKARESIPAAFAEGTKIGGPVLGGIYALAAGAATAGMVADLASTQYGGGGSVSAGGGTTAVPSAPPPPPVSVAQQQAQRDVSIVVSGGLHSDEDVRNLVARISDVQKDMGGAATLNIQ